MFLMCTLIALTRVRSIIHKLIYKGKQYLQDLYVIEKVCATGGKMFAVTLIVYIALHSAITYRQLAGDLTN